MALSRTRVCAGIVFAAFAVALSVFGVRAFIQRGKEVKCDAQLEFVYLSLKDYSRGHGGHLPPPYVEGKEGTPLHSWRAVILPSIRPYEYIYRQYRFSEPWNSRNNSEFANATSESANAIDDYACPAHSQSPEMTNYVAVVGDNTLWPPPKPDADCQFRVLGESTPWPYIENCRLSSGSPDTILLVELVRSDIPWAEPRDITLDDFLSTIQSNPKGKFYNKSVKGIKAVDASGRIQVIDPTDDIDTIRRMFLVK
jgi:hypothetical protein